MIGAILAFLWAVGVFIVSLKFITGVVVGTVGHVVFARWAASAKAKIASIAPQVHV